MSERELRWRGSALPNRAPVLSGASRPFNGFSFYAEREGDRVGRRLLVAQGFEVVGEVLDREAGRWQPCAEVMGYSFEPLSAEEAPGRVGDAALVTAETDHLGELRHEREEQHGERSPDRLAWIERAIEQTLDEVKDTAEEIQTELMFSVPGDFDSEYSHDQVAWIRAAYATIERLVAEHRTVTEAAAAALRARFREG